MKKLILTPACGSLAAALMLLSGCTTNMPVQDAQDAICGASQLDSYVGMTATNQVKSQIAAVAGPRPTRYIGPDDAVTMDYNPARLNAELTDADVITRFYCG